MKKAIVSWSSGKDSAWALHTLRQSRDYEIVGLITTLNEAFDRVAMHSTRRRLVELQAEALGLPLTNVPLPWPCSNEHYEARMKTACANALEAGVDVIAFGDLYLEDVRKYREELLRGTGITPVFPLWHMPTRTLMQEMLSAGVKTRIVTVDPSKLPESFAGRDLDATLLGQLPPGVDPCGENGEFHTFVYDGPMFGHPVPIANGQVVKREGYVFADLLPRESRAQAQDALTPSCRFVPSG